MRFEISERIATQRTHEEILSALETQFRKVSQRTRRVGENIEVQSVQASFGSINRTDVTNVSLRNVSGEWLVVADVHYRPSVAFWIILLVTMFTWVFWLVPIVFYLTQKNTVTTGIVECLERVRKEFEPVAAPDARAPARSPISDIEKLGALKEKGLITNDEFDAKKKQLLKL